MKTDGVDERLLTGRWAWTPWAALGAVCAAVFLTGTWTLPLTDPDESRCAVIAQEMMRGGDWIVPHLDGKMYPDKPAPFFWLAAAGWRLTGSMELGGRLVAALAGMLAVLATYSMGRRMFGAWAGLLGGVVLATSGMFAYMARWYRMDMPFAAGMWGAVWWFWRAESKRIAGGDTLTCPGRSRDILSLKGEGFSGGVLSTWLGAGRKGWYGFYAFCGIATLFKGPAGLLLPALVVGTYLLLSGRPRRIFEMVHVGGILVYLAIAAPWYVMMTLREPEYAWDFFVVQNLMRYGGATMGDHEFLGIMYVPILLVGILPWTALLPATCARYFPIRFRERMREPGTMLMWVAALTPLVFFSFSDTKLVGYILPVLAPLAVLMGAVLGGWLESRERDRLAGWSIGVWLGSIVLQLGVLAGLERWLGALDRWFAIPAAAGLACAVAGWWCLRRDKRLAFMAVAVATVLAGYVYIIAHTGPAGYRLLSTRELARMVEPGDGERSVFYFTGNKRNSFALYTGAKDVRRVTKKPETFDELVALMKKGEPKTYCVINARKDLERLEAACPGKIQVVGESGGRWLVVNQP